ncbi:MAG: diaminopimelate epimerase [Deltaproteobacteria bacterium]|nr:MAG: diaminopimelate epimerase [Deltaproteobacteria bacterium]
MSFEFWKYHGLGNDFVLVDGKDVEPHYRNDEQVIAICDRHLGIGADGILWLEPSEKADFRMIITNSDGSRPEMCGNGLRCFARFLYDQGYTSELSFSVETDRGVLQCELERDGTGAVANARVEMGAPMLNREDLPMVGEGTCIEQSFSIAGESLSITGVSMGNPHAILFDIPKDKQGSLGPLLETHELFPDRTNVEFVDVVDNQHLNVDVFERGCGWTQACGTGACASVVAAIKTERIPHEGEVFVKLPGGTLGVTVLPDFSNIFMSGPAVPVFCGTWTS